MSGIAKLLLVLTSGGTLVIMGYKMSNYSSHINSLKEEKIEKSSDSDDFESPSWIYINKSGFENEDWVTKLKGSNNKT